MCTAKSALTVLPLVSGCDAELVLVAGLVDAVVCPGEVPGEVRVAVADQGAAVALLGEMTAQSLREALGPLLEDRALRGEVAVRSRCSLLDVAVG